MFITFWGESWVEKETLTRLSNNEENSQKLMTQNRKWVIWSEKMESKWLYILCKIEYIFKKKKKKRAT